MTAISDHSVAGVTIYSCECGRTYKYSHSLRRHKRYECGKSPGFQCYIPGCSYVSKRKDNLKAHVRCQHLCIVQKVDI